MLFKNHSQLAYENYNFLPSHPPERKVTSCQFTIMHFCGFHPTSAKGKVGILGGGHLEEWNRSKRKEGRNESIL